jgi:hypothetical protein
MSRRAIDPVRFFLLPLLIGAAVALTVYLRVYLWIRSPRSLPLHSKAIDNIDRFLEQYPFHLYPILSKCLELAYLQSELPVLLRNRVRVLEMAIGEGSFSKLIFSLMPES